MNFQSAFADQAVDLHVVLQQANNQLVTMRSGMPFPWILIGLGEGADLIAKHYYDFYALKPPLAVILMSPSVQPLHLNNLTCPYLVLHGEHDPVFESVPYSRFEQGVLHHQYRYGDLTRLHWFPFLNRQMRNVNRTSPEGREEETDLELQVISEIMGWIGNVLEAPRRKQEPGVPSAA